MKAVALKQAVGRDNTWSTRGSSATGATEGSGRRRPIIDVALVGHWAAPNLTSGEGSITKGFAAVMGSRGSPRRAAQGPVLFDAVVGIRQPVDHELSDIVAFIDRPPVNREMGAVKLGPGLRVSGRLRSKALGASRSTTRSRTRSSRRSTRRARRTGATSCRSAAGATARTCPAAKWRGTRTCRSSRTSRRTKPGSRAGPKRLHPRASRRQAQGRHRHQQDDAVASLGRMTDTELKSIWAYLQTVPPLEKGNH